MSMPSHRWDLTPREAMALQKALAERVVAEPTLGTVHTVAGIDASYKGEVGRAAIALFSFPDLDLVKWVTAERPIDFPYVPGLLSFREGPVVLEALKKLGTRPDLLIFDAHGLAHPRRFGLACHIGVLRQIPSIGCAKRRLVGHYEEPESTRGSTAPLIDEGEVIGAVVRTRTDVKPLFVSVGHRVDLETAVHYVLACGGGYKLPEPTRWADKIAGGSLPPGA